MYLSWIKKKRKRKREWYRYWYWAIDSLETLLHFSIVWERFHRVWARIMRHEMAVLVSSTHLAKVKASSTSTKLPLKRSRETRTSNDPLCTRSLRSTTLPSIPITYSVFSCDHFLSLSPLPCYSISIISNHLRFLCFHHVFIYFFKVTISYFEVKKISLNFLRNIIVIWWFKSKEFRIDRNGNTLF